MGLGLRLRIWDEPNPVHLAGKTGKNQEKSDKNGILRINPGSSTLPGRIQHQIRGFSHSQIRPKNSNKTFQPPPKKPQIYGKLLQLFLKNSFKCSKISNSGFIPENRREAPPGPAQSWFLWDYFIFSGISALFWGIFGISAPSPLWN